MVRDHLSRTELTARSAPPRLGGVREEPFLGRLELSDPPPDRPAPVSAAEPPRKRVGRRQGSHLAGNELKYLSVQFIDASNARGSAKSDRGQVVQEIVNGRRPGPDRSTDRVTHPDHHTGVTARKLLLEHEQSITPLEVDGDLTVRAPTRPSSTALNPPRERRGGAASRGSLCGYPGARLTFVIR